MDLVLSGSQVSGIEAAGQIRAARPTTRILALSAYVDETRVLGALGAGVAGYILKTSPHTEIVEAVRIVAAGRVLFDPQVLGVLRAYLEGQRNTSDSMDGESQSPHLTAQEWKVLELLAQDCPNKSIAARLVISERTVKTHVSHILAKLNVTDRARAKLWYNLHAHDHPR